MIHKFPNAALLYFYFRPGPWTKVYLLPLNWFIIVYYPHPKFLGLQLIMTIIVSKVSKIYPLSLSYLSIIAVLISFSNSRSTIYFV